MQDKNVSFHSDLDSWSNINGGTARPFSLTSHDVLNKTFPVFCLFIGFSIYYCFFFFSLNLTRRSNEKERKNYGDRSCNTLNLRYTSR